MFVLYRKWQGGILGTYFKSWLASRNIGLVINVLKKLFTICKFSRLKICISVGIGIGQCVEMAGLEINTGPHARGQWCKPRRARYMVFAAVTDITCLGHIWHLYKSLWVLGFNNVFLILLVTCSDIKKIMKYFCLLMVFRPPNRSKMS